MIMLAQFAATLLGRLSIIGGGVAALLALYYATKYSGVKQERARVAVEAIKTHEKAAPARRAAERDPASVLGRYFRD
jgi:hypothetical protein